MAYVSSLNHQEYYRETGFASIIGYKATMTIVLDRSTTMSASSTPVTIITPQMCGGLHLTLGAYLGGSDLNSDYEIEDPHMAYQFSSQRRHPKTIAHLESDLKKARDSIDDYQVQWESRSRRCQYNGNWQRPFSRPLGREDRRVRNVELLLDGRQGTFGGLSLFKNKHRFTVNNIVDEYTARTESQ